MFYSRHLCMRSLQVTDAPFILSLLNSEAFLRFIGDRQVRTLHEARRYITNLLDNETVTYWVACLRSNEKAIGIVSFIQREYLAFHDIGFAFLPEYCGYGYAGEASQAMLTYVVEVCPDQRILAAVMPDNVDSVRLLERLGLRFDQVLTRVDADVRETLHLYAISRDELLINRVSQHYFDLFSNRDGRVPRFDELTSICLDSVLFNHRSGEHFAAANLTQFIQPRQEILTNGYLREFEEYELSSTTHIMGNIAQRQCVYGKEGVIDQAYFSQKGNKLLQFVKECGVWKINSALWEDEAMTM